MLNKFARLLKPDNAVAIALEEAKAAEREMDALAEGWLIQSEPQTGIVVQFYWKDRPFAEGSYPLDTPIREIVDYATAMGYEAEIVRVVR
jgi:hypothetical protein